MSLAAGILVRRNVVTPSQIQALSAVTVNIFLPCLIVNKTLAGFHPAQFTNWWILPAAGILIVMIGLLASGLLFRLNPEKTPLMVLASMQNAVYIILPIGQILFADQFDRFALYCFLMVLGLNPMMWSIGKVMISKTRQSGILWQDYITPPNVATVISMAAVLTGLAHFIPASVIASIDLLGQATIPLAVFILGATIGAISFDDMPPLRDTLIVTAVKFFIVPATVFAVLHYTRLYVTMPLFCSLMIMQASSPPATNHILIVKRYGGDTQTISSMMLIQYLLCILFMPLWIAAWQYVAG
jgi:hypothetical protein